MENNIDIHKAQAKAIEEKMRSMAGYAAAKNAERIYESLIRQREVVGEKQNELTVNIRMTIEDYGLSTKVGVKDVVWSTTIKHKDDEFWSVEVNPSQLELPLDDGEAIEVDSLNENIVENAPKWPPLRKNRPNERLVGAGVQSIYDLEAVAKKLRVSEHELDRMRSDAVMRLQKIADDLRLRMCWFTLGKGKVYVREKNGIGNVVVIPDDSLIAGKIDEYADAISIGENGLLPHTIFRLMDEGYSVRKFDLDADDDGKWNIMEAVPNKSPFGFGWREVGSHELGSALQEEISDWTMEKNEIANAGWLLT